MTPIPEDFKSLMHETLPSDAPQLLEALEMPPVTSVRLNRRKPGAEFEGASPVPWCTSGLYLEKRPEFIFDPLLHAGAYYVQDASSMIYETLVEKLVNEFFASYHFISSPSRSLQVLDLCAAPGGKTTAMINALPDGSFVTANEYTKKRVAALQENIERWGYPLVKITNKGSDFFAMQGESFDIVAVDAPCSGEGMMRKDEVARSQWSLSLIKECAVLQKEIISNAVKALKPGGFLIYSTCTFNRLENEENAEYARDVEGLIPYNPVFPEDWGISKGINTMLPVYRFMPHKTKGEGLFLAVLKKPGEWEPSHTSSSLNHVTHSDNIDFLKVDVDKETAIKYLKGESVVLPSDVPKGMVTITYKGFRLGDAKNIGSRANNHLPKNRRILKR